ncbi:lycopene cyclase domain-containing protein [Salinibacter altiplanensis]|uniref:lycopene cyclase domain-containing protein n=1 Tax=Salinibacter altiplanensis TaxID=1803181 RepID=UPI000C9ED408|nr:lycopene cyclase domain-containing protein [Salinibacter altiplanensis]
MSYLSFHLVFLVPPILGMMALHRRPRQMGNDLRVDLAIPVVCLIALTYTTPWDNYLVAQEVWWYGANRVVGTIGYVPVEEYMFFVLQPFLTGLFLYQYLHRSPPVPKAHSSSASWTGAAVFAGLTGLGAFFLMDGRPSTLYLALILVWAPPILAGMWLYDGETLWALRSSVFVTTGLPTLYLWGADTVAIRSKIWTIAPEYTVGASFLGLPLEEALFFLFTNLLVVQGILLFLYGSHKAVAPEKETRLSIP